MIQRKVHDATEHVSATETKYNKTLHWESLISGETALEMARTIEKLFNHDSMTPAKPGGAPAPPGKTPKSR
eukprot:7580704-Pyramimonas_sp.AAC.1